MATKYAYTFQTKNGQRILQKIPYVAEEGLTGQQVAPSSETGSAISNVTINTIGNIAGIFANANSVVSWLCSNWQLLIIGGVALLLLFRRL